MSRELKDLPLHSLNSKQSVIHYIIDLECIIESKIFVGSVLLFLGTPKEDTQDILILDTCTIKIKSVKEVEASDEDLNIFMNSHSKSLESCRYWLSKGTLRELPFVVEEWSTKINLGLKTFAIQIEYETSPSGKSLTWTRDDAGNLCVITAGSLINNRSLLPHQDAPALMATWQLIIKIPNNFTVVTTGDEIGSPIEDGKLYFYTHILLPLSTFAIAIGKWLCQPLAINFKSSTAIEPHVECQECHHPSYPCPFDKADIGPGIPTRIVSTSITDTTAVINYLPSCYQVLYDLLGRHLVFKMDIVILPKTVSFLGLTSPGMILLSPSILYGSSPMLDRLAHEVSHSWFGVHIGPRYWEEEWISEGFATFMEDVVELKISKDSSTVFLKEWMALKAMNRYEVLASDCQNIESSPQRAALDSPELAVVRNGLDSSHVVSQIPYAKGYFFLYDLASAVGLDPLMRTFRKYVRRFHGNLVTTKEIIDFFCLHHEEQRSHITQSAHHWLYSERLTVHSIGDLSSNSLNREVTTHFEYWMSRIQRNSKTGDVPPLLLPTAARSDQLIALLDRFLHLDARIPGNIVRKLIDVYEPHRVNATAYHRLCELVVANRYRPAVPLVNRFLLEHVAMGAYLYGELIITSVDFYRNIALQAYHQLEPCLESEFKAIVCDILGLQ